MSAACFLHADLDELRLYTDGTGRTGAPDVWTAPPLAADVGAAETPAFFRARAQAAGIWLARHPGAKRGIALACLDVSEISCLWLRAPSAAPQVLATALRALGQDWGPEFAIGSIEPIAPTAAPQSRFTRKADAADSGFAGVVIRTPDAIVRLWLDELDKRGVRPGAVVTLWHAMALAWDDAAPGADSVTATVLVEPDRRLIWAWSRSGEFITGGSVTLPGAPPPIPEDQPAEDTHAHIDWTAHAAQRLSLDWLSWSAQTGVMPQRLMIVGPGSAEIARVLRASWKDIPARTDDTADPLGATITRAAVGADRHDAAATSAPTGASCLPSLTARPTRAVRTRYMLGGVATLAVAAGVALLGLRFQSAARDTRAAGEDIKKQVAERVTSLTTELPQGVSNVRMALDSRLADMRRTDPPRLPASPRPIWQETRRFLDEIAKHEGVKIADQLFIESRNNSAVTLDIPDRRAAEALAPALEATTNGLSWKRQNIGVPNDQQLRITGTWIEPRPTDGRPRP